MAPTPSLTGVEMGDAISTSVQMINLGNVCKFDFLFHRKAQRASMKVAISDLTHEGIKDSYRFITRHT